MYCGPRASLAIISALGQTGEGCFAPGLPYCPQRSRISILFNETSEDTAGILFVRKQLATCKNHRNTVTR
jgi:hypothetical protein